jgi:hypothetical protein
VGGTSREGGSGLRGGDAIELVVGEGLRASGVEIVGDAVDMASIVRGDGIDKVVGDVDGVTGRRRSRELVGLEARIVGVLEVEAGEGGRLADGERIEGALGRVADGPREAAGRDRLKVSGVRDSIGSIRRLAGTVSAVIFVRTEESVGMACAERDFSPPNGAGSK